MSKKPRKIIRIALSGARGRMGREIVELANAESSADVRVQVIAEIDRYADWKGVNEAKVDVVVDFSNPKGAVQALDWALEAGKPIVSGTTGLSPVEMRGFNRASKKIPVLYSGNMSLGVAVMSSMLKNLGAVSDWNFQIEEAHHAQKKDRPSGTALLLQTALTRAVGRRVPPPLSIRGGGIPGIHQVWAMGPEESLTIQHTAFKRTVFARGALAAVRWLFDKKEAGIYDLSHLYSIT